MSDPSFITKTVSLITIANVDSKGSRLVKFIVTIFSAFAIDPDEQRLSEIIVTGLSVGFVLSKTTWEALGNIDYGRKSSEEGNVQFRRSLYFTTNLKRGDVLSEEHIKSIRPGFGLPPKYFDEIIGKKVSSDVEAGTATSWDVIEK